MDIVPVLCQMDSEFWSSVYTVLPTMDMVYILIPILPRMVTNNMTAEIKVIIPKNSRPVMRKENHWKH